jgi:hypothetical protein
MNKRQMQTENPAKIIKNKVMQLSNPNVCPLVQCRDKIVAEVHISLQFCHKFPVL